MAERKRDRGRIASAAAGLCLLLTLALAGRVGEAHAVEALAPAPDDAEVARVLERWRSGEAVGTVVLDPLLAERIDGLVRSTPTFAAAWERLGRSGVPVVIGTRDQLDPVLPRDVRRSDGWAGVTVTWGGAGDVLERSAVAFRREWLRGVHERVGNSREAFLRALDDLIIHEVYGHLVPVVEARSVRARCADPRPGERLADSCVGRRELAVRAERDRLIRAARAGRSAPAALAASRTPEHGAILSSNRNPVPTPAPEPDMVDVHNHLLPGVDDGAVDLEDSRVALAAMREQGVDSVVCTPHLSGALTQDAAALDRRLSELDDAWAAFVEMAKSEFPDVRVARGAEVMLDTPSPALDDPRVRLAGSRFVLVEFPMATLPPNTPAVLARLVERGATPVIAHPERYFSLARRPGLLDEWRGAGCYVQSNCGSLLGQYGAEARRAVFSLLERGAVDYLASDYHTRGRLGVRACHDTLARMGASAQADLLLDVNPGRILAGESPEAVAPIENRGWLGSLLRWKR